MFSLKKTLFALLMAGMLVLGLGQLTMASGMGMVQCSEVFFCDACPEGPGAGPTTGGYIYYLHECTLNGEPVKNCFESN